MIKYLFTKFLFPHHRTDREAGFQSDLGVIMMQSGREIDALKLLYVIRVSKTNLVFLPLR